MTAQNSSFARKTVLITGANGGMGRCLVKKFYEQGAYVICCLRTYSKDFEDFIKALSSDNKSIRAIYFDLADEQQTKEVINRLIGEKITLDVLVNNAAIAGGSSVEMTSLKSLRNIFEINFFSQISLTSRLLRLIKKSDQGRVINIG